MTTLFKNVITESNIEPSMEDLAVEVAQHTAIDNRLSQLTEALESFDEDIDDITLSVVDFSIESFSEIVGLDVSLPSMEEDAPEEKKKESRLDALKKVATKVGEGAKDVYDKIVKKFKEVMAFIQRKVKVTADGIIHDLKKLDQSEKIETFAEHNDPLVTVQSASTAPSQGWTARLGNASVTNKVHDKPEFKDHDDARRAPMAVPKVIEMVRDVNALIIHTSSKRVKREKFRAKIGSLRGNVAVSASDKNITRTIYHHLTALQGMAKLGFKFLKQVKKDVKAHVSSKK